MSAVWLFILLALMVALECHAATEQKKSPEEEIDNLSVKKLEDDYSTTLHQLEDILVKKKQVIDDKLKKKDTVEKVEEHAKINKKESAAKALESLEREAKNEHPDVDSAINSLVSLIKKKDELPNDTPTKTKFRGKTLKASLSSDELDSAFELEKVKKDDNECIDAKGLDYCYNKAIAHECHHHPTEMKNDCARSCGFCCDDDKTLVGVKKCESFKKMKLCEKENYQDRLRIFCPRTCGFCGKAAAEPPCVRSTYGCCWDGDTATHHVGTFDDGCKECKDFYDSQFCHKFIMDCNNEWSLAGQQIRTLCPKTCGRCGPHKICRDDPKMSHTCAELKADGACVSNFHVMKFNCPMTCHICKKSTIDCAHTTYGCCDDGQTIAKGANREGCIECTDIVSPSYDCVHLKKHHACTSHKDRMKVLCPATCGFCNV